MTKSPKLSERRITVTGNADLSLAKLFESVEDKTTQIKKSETSQSNGSYKSLLPPSSKNSRCSR